MKKTIFSAVLALSLSSPSPPAAAVKGRQPDIAVRPFRAGVQPRPPLHHQCRRPHRPLTTPWRGCTACPEAGTLSPLEPAGTPSADGKTYTFTLRQGRQVVGWLPGHRQGLCLCLPADVPHRLPLPSRRKVRLHRGASRPHGRHCPAPGVSASGDYTLVIRLTEADPLFAAAGRPYRLPL